MFDACQNVIRLNSSRLKNQSWEQASKLACRSCAMPCKCYIVVKAQVQGHQYGLWDRARCSCQPVHEICTVHQLGLACLFPTVSRTPQYYFNQTQTHLKNLRTFSAVNKLSGSFKARRPRRGMLTAACGRGFCSSRETLLRQFRGFQPFSLNWYAIMMTVNRRI